MKRKKNLGSLFLIWLALSLGILWAYEWEGGGEPTTSPSAAVVAERSGGLISKFFSRKSVQTKLEEENSQMSSSSLDSKAQQNLSAEDQKKISVIDEVMASRNDNDARLDAREFQNLSPQLKNALKKKYDSLAREKLNEKGLLVYLLSRNIQNPGDIDFLSQVFSESPCLSLSNCSKASTGEATHDEGVNEVSLQYPQLAGIYQLEKYFKAHPEKLKEPGMVNSLRQALSQARLSANPQLKARAEDSWTLLLQEPIQEIR